MESDNVTVIWETVIEYMKENKYGIMGFILDKKIGEGSFGAVYTLKIMNWKEFKDV